MTESHKEPRNCTMRDVLWKGHAKGDLREMTNNNRKKLVNQEF
jgi:hypothetical protein